VNAAMFHEMRFAAQAHERREHAPAVLTHEAAVLRAVHERASRSRAAALPKQRETVVSSQRSPRPERRHTRAQIHAHHLVRLEWKQELKEYRAELREWRHLLTVREQLLRKLVTLERRLARAAAGKPSHPAAEHLYAISGVWFRQTGRGRPAELKTAPA